MEPSSRRVRDPPHAAEIAARREAFNSAANVGLPAAGAPRAPLSGVSRPIGSPCKRRSGQLRCDASGSNRETTVNGERHRRHAPRLLRDDRLIYAAPARRGRTIPAVRASGADENGRRAATIIERRISLLAAQEELEGLVHRFTLGHQLIAGLTGEGWKSLTEPGSVDTTCRICPASSSASAFGAQNRQRAIQPLASTSCRNPFLAFPCVDVVGRVEYASRRF